MEKAIRQIIEALRAGEQPDAAWLDKLVRARNRAMHDGTRSVAKKRLLPFYLQVKAQEPARYESWKVTPEIDAALMRLLQAKPRRTASGVATITVLTRPWPCSSNCVYCPNDIRMPKSYLTDEPACQRAERCWFDPFLQVEARLRALHAMGHVTDKVELIVLGGTWSDYPEAYQLWFIGEMFRALTLGDEARAEAAAGRRAFYQECGLPREREDCAAATREVQQRINRGELSYNEAWPELYRSPAWRRTEELWTTSLEDLELLHCANETADKRVVGLVVETRPDLITPDECLFLRTLGCTKIQMGIQSLDGSVLSLCERSAQADTVAQAFRLLRLFGFKTHIHFMVNLPGATPAADRADYEALVTQGAFMPDEVKLYPCALVESARLTDWHHDGRWAPYTESDLINVLAYDTQITPPFTRISRMIRDISAGDIIAGNKKTNLRQMVEAQLAAKHAPVSEIRTREVSVDGAAVEELRLETIAYQTGATEERFLQWVTTDNRIAGFLRLSLPTEEALAATPGLPIHPGEAMIREVHVYGKVAALHRTGEGTQHKGLGRLLVQEACNQAAAEGYRALNVISAIGTRGYYEKLGFTRNGLYHQRPLDQAETA